MMKLNRLHEISEGANPVSFLNNAGITDGHYAFTICIFFPSFFNSLKDSILKKNNAVSLWHCRVTVSGCRYLHKVDTGFFWVTLLQRHCSSKIMLGILHAPRIVDKLCYPLLALVVTSLWDYAQMMNLLMNSCILFYKGCRSMKC